MVESVSCARTGPRVPSRATAGIPILPPEALYSAHVRHRRDAATKRIISQKRANGFLLGGSRGDTPRVESLAREKAFF